METEFPLNKVLRGKNIQKIMYYPDSNKVSIWHGFDNKPFDVNVDLGSLTKTVEKCEEVMEGQFDIDTMTNISDIISKGLAPYRYVYALAKNGSDDSDRKGKQKKKKIPIKKYSENGIGPLYENVVIGGVSKFVTLDKDCKPILVDNIERSNDILIPADTIDTQNPIPFIFESKEELEKCLEEASKCSLESIFLKVESVNRKYVDIEDHYHVLLTADIIWTWLQDKFGYTHLNIFTGDNGSGKNSQLLVFRYLGYRVFYVVSASAANYYTKMGNVEEGQITIAEDEAGDIADDREKKNVFKSGYCSGGSVPKVELEGGRKSYDWLTYCQKWVAMEELSTHREMKGILDRSFVYRFVAGDPQYNIKDVIKSAGDPEYKPLYDELMHARKVLFCWRLTHYKDIILDVELNVKNRSAELTKPLIRLFQDSPVALERILESLSKFMVERNEIKRSSVESKLYEVVNQLKEERNKKFEANEQTTEDTAFKEYDLAFTNKALLEKTKEVMDCKDTDKPGLFWSDVVGCMLSQTKITNISKSKFKAKPFLKRLQDPDNQNKVKVVRCLDFQEKYLQRIKSSYQMPDKIEMKRKTENVTPVTGVTFPIKKPAVNTDSMNLENTSNVENMFVIKDKNDEKSNSEGFDGGVKDSHPSQQSVTAVTSVTKLDTATENDNEDCRNIHIIINLNYEKSVINNVVSYSMSAIPSNG